MYTFHLCSLLWENGNDDGFRADAFNFFFFDLSIKIASTKPWICGQLIVVQLLNFPDFFSENFQDIFTIFSVAVSCF